MVIGTFILFTSYLHCISLKIRHSIGNIKTLSPYFQKRKTVLSSMRLLTEYKQSQ